MVRAIWVGASVGAVLLAGGCNSTFTCSTDTQCTAQGRLGICQPASGFCSFGDGDCESGQRYGALADNGVAGACVPVEVAGTGSTSANDSADVAQASTTDIDDGTSPVVPDSSGTTGPDSEASSDGLDSSSDTESEPICCHAECPRACGSSDCPTLTLAGPVNGSRAVDIVLVDGGLLWSSGQGRTVEFTDLDTGVTSTLATFSDHMSVSSIVTDAAYVYAHDPEDGIVSRASLATGEVTLLVTAPSIFGANGADIGELAVDDTYVYFAVQTLGGIGGIGGIWRVPKDARGFRRSAPQLVALAQPARDITLDDEFLYYIDGDGSDEVRRIAVDELTDDTSGAMVVRQDNITAFVVDGDFIYYAGQDTIGRADRLGSNDNIETLATDVDNIRKIVVDEHNLYFTASDSISSVPKSGGPVVDLVTSDDPLGLALGCDTVYWAESATGTIRSRLK
ncbi:MAG: hypothetical protein JKY37_30120 [Nannocystaceae bacterium]|nr:hypothetical protein [Nannocystaceae bacterium]